MKNMNFGLAMLFAMLFISLSAQDFQSLKSELESKTVTGKERVDLLLKTVKAGKKVNADSLLVLAEEALYLAQAENYYAGQTTALFSIADQYEDLGENEVAMNYLLQAKKIAVEEKLDEEIGKSIFFIAIDYIYQNEFDQAKENLLDTFLYFDYLSDKFKLRIYNNLANIYYYQIDYATALDYFLKMKIMADSINDPFEIACAMTGIGYILKIKSIQENNPEIAELLVKYGEIQKKIGAEAVLKVNQIHQEFDQQRFDKELELINKEKEYNAIKIKHQKIVIYGSIAFLIILTAALIYAIHFNQKNSSTLCVGVNRKV